MSDEINGMIQAQAELKERLSLISTIKILEEKVRELQEERDGYKNGQEQLQQMVSDLMDVNSKWAEKVKELEEGFEMMKFGWNEEIIKLVKAESRLKRLQEAVDRHKVNTTAPVQTIEAYKIDEELYKIRDEV
jgi:predicted RecB family endonuclease